MPKFTGIDISGHPVGAVIDIGTAGLPFGFILCDGSAISRTTYAALFAAIGITFGPGDGSTTFNVPGLSGRASIGAGTYVDPTSGSITRSLGQMLGEEAHVLQITEMPNHTHTSPTHAGNSGTGPVIFGGEGTFVGTWTSDPTGGGVSHNNMQPSLAFTKAIAYL